MSQQHRVTALAITALFFGLPSCLPDPGVNCADGRVCPPQTQCDDAHSLCVTAEQMTVCQGKAELSGCSASGAASGICRDSVCLPERCGDGLVTGSEQCDGNALNGMDCTGLGHYGGVLKCSANCRFDPIDCAGRCGDGAANGQEICDGTDVKNRQCTDFGWYGGALACVAGCNGLSATACVGYCGDGLVNGSVVSGNEECDSLEMQTLTCVDWGAQGGSLLCTPGCEHSTELCHWAEVVVQAERPATDIWGFNDADLWTVAGTSVVAHFDGHTWTEPCRLQSDGILNGIWGSSPNDLWAVGDDGVILHCTQGGAVAAAMALTPASKLNAVWGRSASDVWSVGEVIAHYDGSAWSVVRTQPSGQELYGVFGTPAGDVWTVGSGRTILRFDGSVWSEVDRSTLPPSTNDTIFRGVWAVNDNDVWTVASYATAGGGDIFHFDGTTWSRAFSTGAGLRAVFGAAANDVWAVGQDRQVFHWDGQSWTPVPSDPSDDFNAVWVSDVGVAWVVGWITGKIDGQGFSPAPASLAQNGWDPWFGVELTGIWVGPNAEGWAVGNDGVIAHQHDGPWDIVYSESWQVDFLWGGPQNHVWAIERDGDLAEFDGALWRQRQRLVRRNGNAATILAVYGSAGNNVWAVGNDLFRFDGTTWQVVDADPALGTLTFNGVWTSGPTDVWLTAEACACAVHYDGTGFTKYTSGITQPMNAVWGVPNSDVWLVGASGATARFDGSEFQPMGSGTTQTLRAIWGPNAGAAWAVGDNGTALVLEGTQWQVFDLGVTDNLNRVWGTDLSDVWITGEQDGALHVTATVDRVLEAGSVIWGQTPTDLWSNGPINPDYGAAYGLVHFDGTTWTPPTVYGRLLDVWGDGLGTVWAVGEAGVLLRRDGWRFEPVATGIDKDLTDLFGLAQNDIWAVGGTAVHFDGTAWSEVPIPSAVAPSFDGLFGVWASASDDVWAVGSNGLVLHFDGSAWQNVPSGTDQLLAGVWGLGPNDVWAVGSGSTALHFDGNAWSPFPVTAGFEFLSVWGQNPHDLWGSAIYGQTSNWVMHYDGHAWTEVASPASGFINRVFGTARDRIWAVGDNLLLQQRHKLPTLPGGDCHEPVPIFCGSKAVGSTTAQSPSALAHYGCPGRDTTGPEASYRFDSPVDGHATFRLLPAKGDLDLVAIGANTFGECAPESCLAASHNSGSALEAITLPVTAGQRLYLVVDGFVDQTGTLPTEQNPSFHLEVSCQKELPADVAATP